MSEWDSTEWRELRDANLRRWFLGNESAVQCFIMISTVSETWDDLIDEPDVPKKLINEAFANLMVMLPTNQFFVGYRNYIEPLIITAVNAWMDSEILVKRGNDKWKMLSFYIRNYGAEIAQMIAFCVGGFENMRKVSIEIREFLNHEEYKEWEHRHVA